MTELSQRSIQMVARPIAVPTVKLPDGFSFVTLPVPALRDAWCALTSRCDLLDPLERACAQFDQEFSHRLQEFSRRCIFLQDNKTGRLVGTTIAWFGDAGGPKWKDYGRIHWVGLLPEYRGKNLGIPMLTRAMEMLAQEQFQACLGTNGFRLAAIRQYLRLGFRPCYTTELCPAAWDEVRTQISHPGLHPLRALDKRNEA